MHRMFASAAPSSVAALMLCLAMLPRAVAAQSTTAIVEDFTEGEDWHTPNFLQHPDRLLVDWHRRRGHQAGAV